MATDKKSRMDGRPTPAITEMAMTGRYTAHTGRYTPSSTSDNRNFQFSRMSMEYANMMDSQETMTKTKINKDIEDLLNYKKQLIEEIKGMQNYYEEGKHDKGGKKHVNNKTEEDEEKRG